MSWEYTNRDGETQSLAGATIANTGETRGASDTGDFTARTDGAFRLLVKGTPDLPAPPDPAKVLVHNLDQVATTSAVHLSSSNWVAQVFRTGADAHTLESIEVAFGEAISATDIGDLSASVWSVNTSTNRPRCRAVRPREAVGNCGIVYVRRGE